MMNDPTKFSRFITCMVFEILQRSPTSLQANGLPPSPPLHSYHCADMITILDQVMKYAPHILNAIHQILKCTAQSIALSTVLLALKYMDRIQRLKIKVTSVGSEAHLFCICLIIAQKSMDDHAYKNRTWSKITRMPSSLITQMERECLTCLNYNLYVSKHEFDAWYAFVQKRAIQWNHGLSPAHTKPLFKPFKRNLSSLVHSVKKHRPLVSGCTGCN